jgi:hypothetical protein
MKTLKAVKYIAIFVAVAILFLVVSYNYTYVELFPDYENVKFTKMRVGSISLELPDFFSDTSPYSSGTSIIYPDFKLHLREDNNSDKKDIESQEIGCIFPKNEERNREEDFELSQVSKYRAVLMSPQTGNLKNEWLSYVFFLNNNSCAWISTQVKEGDIETQKIAFKNNVIKFFKYFKFVTDGDIDEPGFRTALGLITHNNEFIIESNIYYQNWREKNSSGSIEFSIKFKNSDWVSEDNYKLFDNYSVGNRLTYYVITRLYDKSILDYRWAYKTGDVQLSSLYFGKEFIYIPNIKNGRPVEYNMMSHVQAASGKGCFSKYIVFDMSLWYYATPGNENYNTVFGYWTRAKDSMRCVAS